MTTIISPPAEPVLADLMVGFDALTRRVEELVAKNSALEQQLKAYTQQAEITTLEPSRRSSDQIQSTAPTSVSEWRGNDCFAPGIEAWKKLKEMRGRNIDAEKLERDFTTPGRVGDLRCPFAQRAARRLPQEAASLSFRPDIVGIVPYIKEEADIKDPIAAEFHPNIAGSPPASVQNSMAKCPIRFLDDHSPEEVAKYFENHKHEIPRSHEICVKRYQSNEESIRSLDAKYGNLVNMIQGLGMKHQPMLNVTDDEETDQKSIQKVKQWAENCVESSSRHLEEEDGLDSEPRTGHFERPLQEVRLGESPSRPWGIQVPLEKQIAASANGSADSNAAQSIAAAMDAQEALEPRQTLKRCPFSQRTARPPVDLSRVQSAVKNGPKQKEEAEVIEPLRTADKKTIPASIIFNGPVFFGCQASDIEAILRGLQCST